jgi:integrase
MGTDRGISTQKREPNGNQLALAYLRGQCGALFRRGFQLVAHRQLLYVRTAGTKVPLRLDLTASWQQVQERCAALQEVLGNGEYDPEVWADRLGSSTRRRRSTDLEALVELWRRRKLAEGCSEGTFSNDYERYLRRLNPRRPLTESSILAAIESVPAASSRRRRVVKMYREVAAATGTSWNGALLDPLQAAGRSLGKRALPFLTDSEIEQVIAHLKTRRRYGWWRAMGLMAVYGLRPWEAWVAVPSSRPGCIEIPVGKKSMKGTSPPRTVPPFHARWIETFELEEAAKVPLPARNNSHSPGSMTSSVLQQVQQQIPGLCPGERRCSGYAFRHAYARRIHGPEYRVTDAHGALFMGHTVAVHNLSYRSWIEGSEDPLDLYLPSFTSRGGESAGPPQAD